MADPLYKEVWIKHVKSNTQSDVNDQIKNKKRTEKIETDMNCARELDVEGISVDRERISVDGEGISVDREGISVDVEGISVDEEGISVDREGISVDREGIYVDGEGISQDMSSLKSEIVATTVLDNTSILDLEAVTCCQAAVKLVENGESEAGKSSHGDQTVMCTSQTPPNIPLSACSSALDEKCTASGLLLPSVECRACQVKPLANDSGDSTGICLACDACHASLVTEHKLIQLYLICSIILVVFLPLFGIPALIYSLRSHRAHTSRRSDKVPQLARCALLYIILGSACMCAAIPIGCLLAAYLNQSYSYTSVKGVPVLLSDLLDSTTIAATREVHRVIPQTVPEIRRQSTVPEIRRQSTIPEIRRQSTVPSPALQNNSFLNGGGLDFINRRHNSAVFQKGRIGKVLESGDMDTTSEQSDTQGERKKVAMGLLEGEIQVTIDKLFPKARPHSAVQSIA